MLEKFQNQKSAVYSCDRLTVAKIKGSDLERASEFGSSYHPQNLAFL